VTAKAAPSHRAMKLRPLEAEQLEVDQKPWLQTTTMRAISCSFEQSKIMFLY
jgi:hypothetical protein